MITKITIQKAKRIRKRQQKQDSWSIKSIENHLKYLETVKTNRPNIMKETVDYWTMQLNRKKEEKTNKQKKLHNN